MKEMILRWCDNVHRHGYYKECSDEMGATYFENDKADFESESEFNKCMCDQIAFDDKHIRK